MNLKRDLVSAVVCAALLTLPSAAVAQDADVDNNIVAEDGTQGLENVENEIEIISETEESAAETKDAHFFVRYDNSNQEETGSTHYSPTKYFPIGETAEDYSYGDAKSDYTSADGEVYSDTAYVEGAENIVTEANVNVYNDLGVTKETIKEFFSPVYSDIAQEPSREVVGESIKNALGLTWYNAYSDGRVDVLWYVVKNGGAGYINVDGVLYWIKTGDVVDKDDNPDNPKNPDNLPDPEPTPEPEPEPTPEPTPDPEPAPEPAPEPDVDPEPTPEPDVKPDPEPTPDVSPEPDTTPEPETPETKTEETSATTEIAAVVTPANQEVKEEVIEDNEVPLAAAKSSSLPATGENTVSYVNFGLAAAILVMSAYLFWLTSREN